MKKKIVFPDGVAFPLKWEQDSCNSLQIVDVDGLELLQIFREHDIKDADEELAQFIVDVANEAALKGIEKAVKK